MSRAFVFPGQGAQTIGMGRALAEAYPAAKAVFDEVDAALGENLSALIWEGDIAELTLTANAQPALMATSIAALRALEAEGFGLEQASFVAGHSLGEYSALCAAGSLTLSDTARLLRIRGQAMQEAVPVGVGAMAALLGLNFEAATAVALEAAQGEVCQAANDNDPAQVVVSGHAGAVGRALDIARAKGAKRAILLPVSAPFHCALMKPAEERLAPELRAAASHDPRMPVVANVDAEPKRTAAAAIEALIRQVSSPVRWENVIQRLASEGVTRYVEVGPGKVLSGLVKKIVPGAIILNVEGPGDLAAIEGLF